MDEQKTNGVAGGVSTDARPSNDDAQQNRDIAALGYVWILSIIVYFGKKNSPFVLFHARQGMVLFVLSIVAWFIPFVGRVLELVVLAFCVLGFLSAAQGQWKELPLIGAIARRDRKGMRESWRVMTDGAVRMWNEWMKLFHKHAEKSSAPPPVARATPPVPSSPPTPPPPRS